MSVEQSPSTPEDRKAKFCLECGQALGRTATTAKIVAAEDEDDADDDPMFTPPWYWPTEQPQGDDPVSVSQRNLAARVYQGRVNQAGADYEALQRAKASWNT